VKSEVDESKPKAKKSTAAAVRAKED